MLVDIIELIVCLAFCIIVVSLAYAVWKKVVDKAYKCLEDLFGEKASNCIALVVLVLITIAIIIEAVRP